MIRTLMCRAAVGFTAALCAASFSSAATVFLDDFNRPNGALAGSTPNTGGAWSAISGAGTNALQIVGGAVPMTTSGEDDLSLTDQWIPTTVGNPIHTAIDITVSAAQANGDYFAHLGDGSTSIFFQRLFAKSTTGGYLLGLVDTSGTGSTPTYGTTVLTFGTPYHVDINWTPVAGNNNDTFAVLVNSAAYLTHSWTSTTVEPTLVKSASLRQGGAGNAPTLTVDNYSVDAQTTIPTPEPASVLMLAILGFAGLGAPRAVSRRGR